jgi:hypothetical protein
MLRVALVSSLGATCHGCRTIREYCPANGKLPYFALLQKSSVKPRRRFWNRPILAVRRSGIPVPNRLHSHGIECRNPADRTQ